MNKRSLSLSFATGPASPRAQVIGLSLVAIILMLLAGWTGFHSFDLDRNGIRTVGIVIEFEHSKESRYPVFSFADAQGRRHAVRAQSTTDEYAIGDSLSVLYPATRPLDAGIDTPRQLYFIPVLLGGLSIVFFAGASLAYRFKNLLTAIFTARRGQLTITKRSSDGSITQSTRSSLPLLKWTARVVGTLGLFFFGVAIWFGWNNYELAREGVKTQGTVTKLVRSGRNHRPWFEFIDGAGETRLVKSINATNEFLVGDQLPIIYPPNDPHAARIIGQSTYLSMPGYFGFLGTLFLLVTVFVRSHLSNLLTDLPKGNQLTN